MAWLLGAVVIAAALIAWGGYEWGVAHDCLPQQQDGQCGMATGFGEFFGRVGAGIVLVLGGGWVVLRWKRQ